MRSSYPLSTRRQTLKAALPAALLLLLAGCASAPDGGGIFVPVGGVQQSSSDESGPAHTPANERQPGKEPSVAAEPASDESVEQERKPRPSHREQAQTLSPAAATLVKQADKAFRAGNVDSGMASLQRAQRISPDAAVIYYKMAEGYVRADSLARAEQFAQKGVSLAGSDQRLMKAGWQLLSDIRRAQGNVAGAEAAESRASAL